MVRETEFMLHAFYMGIFIPFVYDNLRIVRRAIPHANFLVSLEDMGFWIYCAIKLFLLMYYESNGTLRWFAVCSALVGMFLYMKVASPLFVKIATLILGKIWESVVRSLAFVLKPVRKVIRRIKKKLTFQKKVFKMNLKGR